jgi:hypothetical protein
MPLLDPFLIPPQLLLDLADRRFQDAQQVFALFVSHEIVLMLGRNLQIDLRLGVVLQVHHNFDRHQTVENPNELLGLGPQLFLRRLRQMPMSRRNTDLHGSQSLRSDRRPGRSARGFFFIDDNR